MKSIFTGLAIIALFATQSATASPIGGSAAAYDVVDARTVAEYTVNLRGQQTTYIAVYGDGDTDLDLFVYDGRGNLIAYDTTYSGNGFVTLVPRYDGPVTICIENLGDVYNEFNVYAW
jgi:hypothetical protein